MPNLCECLVLEDSTIFATYIHIHDPITTSSSSYIAYAANSDSPSAVFFVH